MNWNHPEKNDVRTAVIRWAKRNTPYKHVLVLPGQSCLCVKEMLENKVINRKTLVTAVEKRKDFASEMYNCLHQMKIKFLTYESPIEKIRPDSFTAQDKGKIDFAFLDVCNGISPTILRYLRSMVKFNVFAPHTKVIITNSLSKRNNKFYDYWKENFPAISSSTAIRKWEKDLKWSQWFTHSQDMLQATIYSILAALCGGNYSPTVQKSIAYKNTNFVIPMITNCITLDSEPTSLGHAEFKMASFMEKLVPIKTKQPTNWRLAGLKGHCTKLKNWLNEEPIGLAQTAEYLGYATPSDYKSKLKYEINHYQRLIAQESQP